MAVNGLSATSLDEIALEQAGLVGSPGSPAQLGAIIVGHEK
jgi:hypothetical protein